MKPAYAAIVVGAGHAGAEAALAIARAGFPALLLTMNLDSICQMSCNPAVGGVAKGHLVREMDALGGQMGLSIDATGIQYRMLNRSKGPAVWAPRAQADKKKYQLFMKQVIEGQPGLDVKQDTAEEILVNSNGEAIGVRTMMGQVFTAKGVVITTGTFLKGLIHIGEFNYSAGRGGEFAAMKLSDNLRSLGFDIKRFKTGTPPRLNRRSIDFSKMIAQPGDEPPPAFSFRTKKLTVQQIPCHITYTNETTHEIIKKNLHRSAMYGGMIDGIGPRYCPSIEDKVVKFAGKPLHQLYLEPEGRDTDEIYLNGLSTSLPQDVQYEIVKTIKGLEEAEIMRLGYAIEYDYAPPTQLRHSLETKQVKNLYFAGQINGTTGYEEAAAQGLMAGLNVVRMLQNQPPFILDRSEAYIGVLVDDLVTKGTNEPYRMFTSLAEFRLSLRQDNADERLMIYGQAFGLITDEVYQEMLARKALVKQEISRLKKTRIGHESLEQILKKQEVHYADLPAQDSEKEPLSLDILQKVEFDIKYAGYLKRQDSSIKKFKRLQSRKIPDAVNYSMITGISKEAIEKLIRVKPASFDQAARIPGVTSCDLSLLAIHIERKRRAGEFSCDYTEPSG